MKNNTLALLVVLCTFLFWFVLSFFIPHVIFYVAPPNYQTAIITAYTSSVDETDDNPFENASGTRPQKGSIACPASIPFGAKVFLFTSTSTPPIEYQCDDRMAAKYRDTMRFDIWLETKEEAFEFGRQELQVVIRHI